MAGDPKFLTFAGPWRGLELDESRQTPQHDEISINVDYSRGRKEARKGFERVASVTAGTHPRMWLSESANGLEQWLLVVGPNSSDSHVYLSVTSHNGSTGQLPLTGGSHDLTSLFGEPYHPRKKVGFVNVTIPYGDGTVAGSGNRKVTLISTEYMTYVFDPCNPDAVVRRLSTSLVTAGGDAKRLTIAQWAYWSTVPHGPIIENHKTETFYAGFLSGQGVIYSTAIESNQDAVPADILTTDNGGCVLQPWMLAWSDPGSPADVAAPRIIQLPGREPITGLKSLGENLYVFTDRSIYVLVSTGDGDNAFVHEYQVHRVVNGTGCISPQSIVENQGVLYFMATDGLYAFGGLSSPGVTKVSVPIDPIFAHNFDVMAVPSAWATALGALGYPYRAARGDLPFCEGLYVPSQKQIWWSLPIEGRPQHSFAATLVLDLVHKAWSVWVKTTATQGASPTLVSCMVSGAVVHRTGQADLVWCVDARGHLCRYGHYRDTGASGDANGVPLYWRTPRIRPSERIDSTYLRVKLKMLGAGKTPSSNAPSLVLTGESSSWDELTEKSMSLTTHPWVLANSPDSLTPFLDGTATLSSDLYFEGVSDGHGGFSVPPSGGGIHMSPDWFDSATEGTVKSPSFRLGVKDDPGTDARGNLSIVQSFSVGADTERDP